MPWLMKAEPFDPALSATRALFFSDIGFATEPDDDPGSVHWRRRIDAPMTVRRALWSGSDIGGFSETTFGAALLANDDGDLDPLCDLDWDGRLVQIWYTPVERPRLADFVLVFNGVAGELVPGDTLEVKLRDLQVLLDVPARRGTFAGTGGVEGSAGLKGRDKPWLVGRRRQIEPVLIDAALNIHLIDPAGIRALLAARDRGVAFATILPDQPSLAALKALSMTATQVATCRALGLVRAGVKPAGRFTVDAEGVAPGGVWPSCHADIVRHVVTSFTTLTGADLDDARFAALAALQPAVVGYWYDGSGGKTVQAVVDELSDTVGAYWGFGEDRRLGVARFDPPAAVADFVFGERDLLDLRPRSVERRMKTLKLGYRPYAVTLTQQEMDGAAIADADKEAFRNDTRWTAIGTHAGAAAQSLLAREEEARTLFDAEADALAERDRRLALFGPRRRAFDVEVPLAPGLEAGMTVRVTDPRFGLAGGMTFRVMEAERDAQSETHKLVIWG